MLIFHSPVDETVSIDNAAHIYKLARHPKIFVSLDDADHLLTDEEDAKYVGSVTATWGGAIFHLSRKGKIHCTNFELFPIKGVSFYAVTCSLQSVLYQKMI